MHRMIVWLLLTSCLIPTMLASAQTGDINDTSKLPVIRSLAWSPDGKKIAASYDDTTVNLWNVSPEVSLGDPYLTIHPELADEIHWTSNSRFLITQGATASYDRMPMHVQAVKWDANSGALVKVLFDYTEDTPLDVNSYSFSGIR